MSFTLTPGAVAPDFELKGTDGEFYSLSDFKANELLVIVFSCNHCPYVIGCEDRLIDFTARNKDRGVALLAINSNETENHPEDDFTHMVQRVKEKGYNFPYLRDETQAAAKAYGAIKTPHFFALDKSRTIRYTGRMDDNPKDASLAKTHELQDAVNELLAGGDVAVAVTDPIGCTIKWWNRDRKFIPNDACDLL